jgi:hypothetical protein
MTAADMLSCMRGNTKTVRGCGVLMTFAWIDTHVTRADEQK